VSRLFFAIAQFRIKKREKDVVIEASMQICMLDEIKKDEKQDDQVNREKLSNQICDIPRNISRN
jgi:hypothetical protein